MLFEPVSGLFEVIMVLRHGHIRLLLKMGLKVLGRKIRERRIKPLDQIGTPIYLGIKCFKTHLHYHIIACLFARGGQ